jgi:CBS domain-containing protein
MDEANDTPAAESEDEAEAVEPESVDTPAVKPRPPSHHPPPPPSLRADLRAKGQTGPDPRFEVNGTPRVARDLMTRKLFTIEPDTKLRRLEDHMETYRFRHLPVVEGEKLVGLITHSDLLHASSSFLSERAKERDKIIHELPASRIMQRELITVGPNESLDDIARMMWEARVRCVLVVEDDDKLVGIITEADFLRLAHHFLANGREQQP